MPDSGDEPADEEDEPGGMMPMAKKTRQPVSSENRDAMTGSR